MLQQLKDLISSLGLSGTSAQIADALNAKTVEKRVEEPVTGATIIRVFGEEVARTLAAKVYAATQSDPLLNAFFVKVNSTGLCFGSDEAQSMIESLKNSGVFTQQEAAMLKGLGVKQVSQWEMVAGEGSVVTPEQVEQALQPVTEVGRSWSLILRGEGQGVHVVWTVHRKFSDGSVGSPVESILSGDVVGDGRVPAEIKDILAPVIAFAGARASSIQ